jgi:hypothetical protein
VLLAVFLGDREQGADHLRRRVRYVRVQKVDLINHDVQRRDREGARMSELGEGGKTTTTTMMVLLMMMMMTRTKARKTL